MPQATGRLFCLRARVAGQIHSQCTGSIAAARGLYRLLDHELVTDILSFDMHRAGALRCAQTSGVEVFLAIQDTTTFNFDTRKALEGLGSIDANNVNSSSAGLLVHSTLLTAADRDQVYGLLGANNPVVPGWSSGAGNL